MNIRQALYKTIEQKIPDGGVKDLNTLLGKIKTSTVFKFRYYLICNYADSDTNFILDFDIDNNCNISAHYLGGNKEDSINIGFSKLENDEENDLISICLQQTNENNVFDITRSKVEILYGEMESIEVSPILTFNGFTALNSLNLGTSGFSNISIDESGILFLNNGKTKFIKSDDIKISNSNFEINGNESTIRTRYNYSDTTYLSELYLPVSGSSNEWFKVSLENNNYNSIHRSLNISAQTRNHHSDPNQLTGEKNIITLAYDYAYTGNGYAEKYKLSINGSLYAPIISAQEFNVTSDKRLKTNIEPISKSVLDAVLNTNIVEFNYTSNLDKPKSLGIIAQDIENNFSELKDQLITISNEDNLDDKRSIKETKLIYILWKALQEEAQKRQELENKLNRLLDLLGDK